MKQKLLKTWLLLCLLLVGVGTSWAETFTTAKSLTDAWTSSTTVGAYSSGSTGYDGVQFGSTRAASGTFTLTSKIQYSNVKSVTIKASTGDKASITSVTVDGVSLTAPANTSIASGVSNKNSSYVFTGDGTKSGTIVITFNASSKAMYVGAIDIVEGSGGSTPTALSAPANLTSSNVTTTGATLSWDAVTNASSYTVKIGGTEYTGVNTNSYSATGLTAATQYTWTVKAVGDGTNYTTSDYAANANFTTEAEQGGNEPGDDEKTGTIKFGTNDVKINAASVTGDDDLDNTWTITTVGTTSFTSQPTYYQVGSGNNPATSITFTTILPKDVNISSMSAKFGGYTSTAGTVTLKVGDTTIGTGSLNATNDVTINSTSTATGNVLTVTVTGIAKGVKVYNISYTYTAEGGESAPVSVAGVSLDNATLSIEAGKSATLTATVQPADATNQNVTWSSSNENIAKVEDGVVTAVAEGEATITVQTEDGNFTATCTVTVTPNLTTYANTYTSGTGLLTTTGGTSATSAKVIWSGDEYDAVKAGVSSTAGVVKVTVPAGTKTLHTHIVGWKGESVKVTVSGLASDKVIELKSDNGLTNSSPFTLDTNPEKNHYYAIETNNAEELTLTFTATTGKRFVIFGVNAEAGEIKPLDHIAVTGAKTLYKVGEAFSTDGMTVTAYYDEDEADSKTISTGYTVSKTEALTADDNTITISYKEGGVTKTADVAINVVALDHIAITTAPTTTAYTEGQSFDKAGMVVTATWGTTAPNVIEETIEDYTVTDGSALPVNKTSVTISYNDKTTEQAITVTALPRYTLHITATTDGTVYTVKDGDQVLSDGDKILYGTNLTCECDESTVPEGYYFSRFYIDFGGEKERYMSSNPATFTDQIPTEGFTELTVRCSILEGKRYTVHFDAQAGNVKPKLLTETAFQSGVVLPAATCLDDDWEFAGWAKEAIEETTTVPATLYKAGETFNPTESTTLYAVYKYGTESGETAFNRVTSLSELTDGKKVVIVSNSTNRVLNLSGDIHTQANASSISESDGKYIWTVGVESDGLTFTDETTSHRAVSFQSTPNPTGNQTSISKWQSTGGWKKYWTVSASDVEDCWTITNTAMANEGGYAALYINNPTGSWGALNLTNTSANQAAFAMRIYVEGPATSLTYNSNPISNLVPLTLVAHNEDGYYATFSNSEAVAFEDAVNVYTVNVTTLGVIDRAEVESKKVPANKAVLINSEVATVYYKTVPSADALGANMLQPASKDMSEISGCLFYKLAYNDYNAGTGLGFWWGAENGGAFSCKTGTAYLAVPKELTGVEQGASVKGFCLNGDIETAILNVEAESKNGQAAIYDLSGRKVSKAQKGIYIVNGRKVLK